jgi:SagB-type dehydrogenase family enzyme
VNKDISYTFDYHEKTKHSEISVMTSRHFLDWENRPIPFKIYLDLPSVSLPVNFTVPSLDAISAINFIPISRSEEKKKGMDRSERHGNPLDNSKPDKDLTVMDVSTLLFFSSGITRVIKYDFGNFYMRAASATGALYPIETYLICNNILPDLRAGVYHFNPAEFSLTRIREGDFRPILASVAGDNPNLLRSPLAIVFSSYAWRNAWKYQSRSYRHWFWDSGVIAANLLAISTSLNFRTTLELGFVDDELGRLLGLDNEKEASVSIAAIDVGTVEQPGRNNPGNYPERYDKTKPMPRLEKIKTYPLSRKEVHYPEIRKACESSKLPNPAEVQDWINAGLTETFESAGSIDNVALSEGISVQQPSIPTSHGHVPSIGEVILKRGSTRKFSRSPISFDILSSIIYNSTRGVPLDFKKDTDTLIDVYLIANDVSGLGKGSYFFNRRQNIFDPLKGNVSREVSGYLCLGQSLFSDASVVIFLMTDLNKVLRRLGNRGYRASQFEAGVIAGKMYLAAYSHGVGASGSTFYDDAVREFFSPHAKNKETMMAVGIGVPAYKSKPGKVLPIKFSREQLLQEYGHS